MCVLYMLIFFFSKGKFLDCFCFLVKFFCYGVMVRVFMFGRVWCMVIVWFFCDRGMFCGSVVSGVVGFVWLIGVWRMVYGWFGRFGIFNFSRIFVGDICD